MPLPVPDVASNLLAGGPVVSAMTGMNALAAQEMKNKILAQKVPFTTPYLEANLGYRREQTKRLHEMTPLEVQHQADVNRLYRPNIESQMAMRNALVQKTKEMMPLQVQHQAAVNKLYAPNVQSQIDVRNALLQKTQQMTPLQVQALALRNKYYGPLSEAQIDQQKATAAFRRMGGGRSGVQQHLLNALTRQISQENPTWNSDQVMATQNAYLRGERQLDDGTALEPPSGTSQQYINAIAKKGTTGALATQGVRAKQADAELGVLTKYAQAGLKPYGDTYLNMSPDQIMDTFKTDTTSQEKLGRFIASQALQYEIAQIRNRIAGGQPGITSTQEMMKMSGQLIDSKFPSLSFRARKEASDYIDQALQKGLEARQRIGYGVGTLLAKPASDASKYSKENLEYTAKQHNISVAEVKKRLGIK